MEGSADRRGVRRDRQEEVGSLRCQAQGHARFRTRVGVWEYDGQDGISTVKDYQRIPTPDWTAIQQAKYIEVLQRVALEEGVHLRTSSQLRTWRGCVVG